MISNELIKIIKDDFVIDWFGIHGVAHWARVRINGLKLAKLNGANPKIIELFAFLHDSKRKNENIDKLHGLRATEFIKQINDSILFLNKSELDLLTYACLHHSDGLLSADLTVQTCWDADRLDLGRVGIKPDPNCLCTEIARKPEFIEWAFQRSKRSHPKEKYYLSSFFPK